MTRTSGHFDMKQVCAAFDVGTPKDAPEPVTGGLLHRVFRLETEVGIFAVKVLNAEIMSRIEAKSNYRLSERIAREVSMNGVRAVPAKMFSTDPWLEINGQYIMLFDWIDGQVLSPATCTSAHCSRMGEVLYQIHNLEVQIEGLESPTFSVVPLATWEAHVGKVREERPSWGLSYETLLQEISMWSHLYQDAVRGLAQPQVASHRDLDSKNVVWNNNKTPYLIDWESAGYVHPTVELIEAAINWSRNDDGTSDKERFQAVIDAYVTAGGALYGNVLDSVYCTFGGMLDWLEYNMRRALDGDVFTMQDRDLGKREVIGTLNRLRKLHASASEYVGWTEQT